MEREAVFTPVVVWDDDKKERLIEYKKKCYTNREIANYFQTSVGAVEGVLRRMRLEEKWRGKVPYIRGTIPLAYCDKIGIIDIEVSNLRADRGFLLTYSIKKYGEEKYYNGVIDPAELRRGLYDKSVVKKLIRDMENFDILVGYYSSGFDIPFIRGRAVMHGFDFPHFGTIKQLDLYYRVKYKYGLSRNSLDAACRMCGIKGKTHIDMDIWLDAATFGSRKALKEILSHNIADVQITEKLYDKIKDYSKAFYKSI